MSWLTRMVDRLVSWRKPTVAKPKYKINYFQVPQWVEKRCLHRPEEGSFEVPVDGWKVFVPATLACADCVERWLADAVVQCQTCTAPILPHEKRVEEASGYVHFPWCCCEAHVSGSEFVPSFATPPDYH